MKTLLASIGITLIVLGFYMNLRGEEGSSEKKTGGWLFAIGFIFEVIVGLMDGD